MIPSTPKHCNGTLPPTTWLHLFCSLRNRLKVLCCSLAAVLPAIRRFLGKNGSLPSLLCVSLYTSAGPRHETSAISSCRGAADRIADFTWEKKQPKEEGNSLVFNLIYFDFISLTLPGGFQCPAQADFNLPVSWLLRNTHCQVSQCLHRVHPLETVTH